MVLRFCLFLLGLCWMAAVRAEPIVIHYPRAESVEDERGEYGHALLKLALEKAGNKYRVELSPTSMQQNRALVELQSGAGRIDVVSTMTSVERENLLLPIRIPMSRGLIGWRLGLVKAERKNLLASVRSVEDLRRYTSGQGHDWPDLAILRHNGIVVYPVTVYSSLFGMLRAERFDWAPRSVHEIWSEVRHHPDLAVDPNILLIYPTADYYFVNKQNTELAENLRLGLETALADGSFGQLFALHFGPAIRRAQLDKRVLIELNNPLLPPQTPLARKELWFNLSDLKRLR